MFTVMSVEILRKETRWLLLRHYAQLYDYMAVDIIRALMLDNHVTYRRPPWVTTGTLSSRQERHHRDLIITDNQVSLLEIKVPNKKYKLTGISKNINCAWARCMTEINCAWKGICSVFVLYKLWKRWDFDKTPHRICPSYLLTVI